MWEIILRTAVAYAFLMLIFRLIGKRELGKLTPFELVTLMLIPQTLKGALTGTDSLTDGLLSMSTLFLLVLVSSALSHRFPFIDRALKSEPTFLVKEGQLDQHAMNAERINTGELFAEMHRKGYERLSQVKYAILESQGHITFIPQSQTPR